MADTIISPQALSDLIGSIYDCALDPSRWDQTLPDIAEVLDCCGITLTVSDLQRNRILLQKANDVEPEHLAQLPRHAPEIHAQLREALACWPSLDEPLLVSRHFSSAYIETSSYFQKWGRPSGIVDTMTFFLMHTPLHLAGLYLGRNERQGIITEREIESGKLLLPHVRRAVMITKLLDVRTIEGARMAEVLDALRCGVVLVNEGGIVLHANRAAEDMLDKGGPIQGSQGILQATAPSAASELRSAITLAAGNEIGIGKTGLAIRLTEPDVPPIFAHVLPLTGSDFRARLQPAAVAAVFIGAPADAQDGADAVAAAFGLTPTETKVLASLFAGRTLAETAETLSISRPTAKTHLEHIFLKTGVTRQAELMRLWTGPISPTGSTVR